MNYSCNDQPKALEIALSGRFTFADAVKFKEILVRTSDAKGREMVFDMSRVEFMDSAAMGMLLLARDTAGKEGVAVALKAPSPQVKRVLEQAKLDSLFDIRP